MALGKLSRVQLGVEGTYGTPVTPTLALEITEVSPAVEQSKITSGALVGKRGINGVSSGPYAVSGSFSFEVNPDNIGLMSYLAFGDEATTVDKTDYYEHAFTPVDAGDELPSFSILVDDVVGVTTYTGCRINKISPSLDPESYLVWTVEYVGQQYSTGGTMEALSVSTKKPYTFNGASLYFGTAGSEASTANSSIASANWSFMNGIEDARQRMDGNAYSAERRTGAIELTAEVEMDWNAAAKVIRDTNFLGDTPLSIKLTYTHASIAGGTQPYQIELDIPYMNVTNHPVDITGPEHIMTTLSMQAYETGGLPICTLTLTDANDTEYSA